LMQNGMVRDETVEEGEERRRARERTLE
jgi:hypothetical protein